MKKPHHKITIVGKKQAREGFVFIHKGETAKCVGCQFHRVCIENLEPNRVYKVVGIREREIPCLIHESGARVVEVVEPQTRMAIPMKEGFEGAVFTFVPKECDNSDCDKRDLCFPLGIESGDRCKIVEVVDRIECALERENPLAVILLRRMIQ
ncbi:MAG: UPF0179 family protein [Candidatus Bathyarchaeota archaeon]|nr:MAG: UPF0179 family protein [Candidatus Bathyarchaeota archaeon]